MTTISSTPRVYNIQYIIFGNLFDVGPFDIVGMLMTVDFAKSMGATMVKVTAL